MLKNLFFLLLCLLAFSSLLAQPQGENELAIPVIGSDKQEVHLDTTVNLYDSPVLIEKDFYVRNVAKLDSDYTGYAFELTESDNLLSQDNSAFAKIGKVYFHLIKDRYHYLFPISFNNRKSIKKYLANRIRPMQPNAIVVRYLHGVRTTTFNW